MVNKIAVVAGLLVVLGLVVLGYYLSTSGQGKSSYLAEVNAPEFKSAQDIAGAPSEEVGNQTARQTVPMSLPYGWE